MLFCEIVAKYDSWFWSATTDTPLEKTSSRWSVIQAWIFQVGVCLCASLCVHAPVDRTHVLPRHGFEDFHFHVFQYSSVRVKVVLKTLAFQSLRKWPCYKSTLSLSWRWFLKLHFCFQNLSHCDSHNQTWTNLFLVLVTNSLWRTSWMQISEFATKGCEFAKRRYLIPADLLHATASHCYQSWEHIQRIVASAGAANCLTQFNGS